VPKEKAGSVGKVVHNRAGYSRVDAALWQGEEEVKVGIDAGGENDDIDYLFGQVVDR